MYYSNNWRKNEIQIRISESEAQLWPVTLYTMDLTYTTNRYTSSRCGDVPQTVSARAEIGRCKSEAIAFK